MGGSNKSRKTSFTTVFGIKLNNKPELNTRLIKETGDYSPGDDTDWDAVEFITPESLENGSKIFHSMMPVPEEFIKK